jgi:hypothetical protein
MSLGRKSNGFIPFSEKVDGNVKNKKLTIRTRLDLESSLFLLITLW